MLCEGCGQEIPWDEYMYLYNRKEYKEENVYIMHTTCIHQKHDKIIESYGSLSLVREVNG